jgi:hypothetical protein
MKRISLGVAMLVCMSAQATEPVRGQAAPVMPAATTRVPASPARDMRAAAAPAAPTPTPTRRLDLRIGDVRNYMTPEEYRALITGREEDRNTIVVQADAPLVPMKDERDVPGGIIAPFWALAHPTKAWRLFLPDPRVNIKDIPPPETKVPRPFAAGVPTF